MVSKDECQASVDVLWLLSSCNCCDREQSLISVPQVVIVQARDPCTRLYHDQTALDQLCYIDAPSITMARLMGWWLPALLHDTSK